MYNNINELKAKMINQAKTKISYMSNVSFNDVSNAILELFFNDCISILKKWKKLKNDSELLAGMYDREITNFITDSHNEFVSFGEKTLFAENKLKATTPQRI